MPETVISFPVDDGPFKAFLDLYNKFQDTLKDLPRQWDSSNEAIDRNKESLDKLMEGLNGHSEVLEKIKGTTEALAAIEMERAAKETERIEKDKEHLQVQKEHTVHAETQASHWREMAKSSAEFAAHIKEATLSILKWAGLTGIIGGLLGGGGLFGIARLADSASSDRARSLGLGVSYGGLRSFTNTMGPLLGGSAGAESFMHGVQESLLDVQKLPALRGLGLNREMLQGKSLTEQSLMVLDRIREDAIQHRDDPTYINRYRALGRDQFLPWERSQQLARIPQREYEEDRRNTLEGAKRANVDDKTLAGWDALSTKLHEASDLIEGTFIRSLGKLNDPIGKLSEGMVKLVEGLVGGEAGKANVDMLVHGLDWLAEHIDSQEFRDHVQHFFDDVGRLVVGTAKFVAFMARIIPGFDDEKPKISGVEPPKSLPGAGGTLTEARELPPGSKERSKALGDWQLGIVKDFKEWLFPKGKDFKEWLFSPSPDIFDKPVSPWLPSIKDWWSKPDSGFMDPLKSPSGSGLTLPSWHSSYNLGERLKDEINIPLGARKGLSGLLWDATYRPDRSSTLPLSSINDLQGLIHQTSFRPSGANNNTPRDVPWGGSIDFAAEDQKHNLPPGTLARISQVESGGRNDLIGSKGEKGQFQFMPGTWMDWGKGGDPTNPGQASEAAGAYMEHLLSVFKGNMEKSLAGYNAGEERVKKALAKAEKSGGDWHSFIPLSTVDYLHKYGYGQTQHTLNGRMPSGNGARFSININNATGGSMVLAARQLA